MQINRDALWKGIIESLIEDFIMFFFPDLAGQIDFRRRVEFLDKELEQIAPDGNNQRRFADKLVQVFLRNGTDHWILIHVEVQGYEDRRFAERMYTYFYRIRDRYRRDTTCLALLTDANPNFRPEVYHYAFSGTVLYFKYNSFKLLDQEFDELMSGTNPFGFVLAVARRALQQKEWPDEQQLNMKVELMRQLLTAKFEKPKIRDVFNFIRQYVRFENEVYIHKFEETVNEITQNRAVMGIEEVILSEFRRIGLEEGRKEGLAEGQAKGLEEGRTEGRAEGRIQEKIHVIQTGHAAGLSLELLAQLTELSTGQVEKVLRGENLMTAEEEE